jgi:hypothetical protein
MADPIVYFRLPRMPTVEEIVHSPSAIADLKAVTGLTQEQISTIQDDLRKASGFLDPKALTAVVGAAITDEPLAEAVHRVLRNLVPNNVGPLLDALSRHLTLPKPPLDDASLKGLRQVLPVLIQTYPALARFKKAERLAEATGRQLESLELICDLRPIFDEDRRKLDGMMPYTRLRVVVTGPDELPSSFEVELTLQQVSDLADKAGKARTKLDVLRRHIENWRAGGLPDLPLTRLSRRESSGA